MLENEKDLLKKSKKGNIESFEQLISAYQKKVYNIALKIVGNHEDASEMAQEVFIKVFKSIGQFKEESSFSTWIYRITTNVCLDEVRKSKNKIKMLSIDEDLNVGEGEIKRQFYDSSRLPEISAERNEMRKVLNQAILSLSFEHRIAVVMRDIQGFSYEEIAKTMKCPEGTVKSRINRARNELREILKKNKELFDIDYVK